MALLGTLTVGILGDMAGLSDTFRSAQSEVQKFGKRMEKVGRDISSIGDTLTRRITMPAVAAAGALTSITLVKGFGRLMGIDTAQAKLRALGHDAASVEFIMTSALDSVRGTAFGLDEAATTAANAVAAGIPPGQELTRYLSLTADTAAIAGASLGEIGAILNKVTTSGRAYNSELQMLSDRGLPIYQWLAEEANTTADAIFDMASKGEVSTEMLLNAIEKNIGGAAKTMGEESFSAAIANIGADIARIGAAFLDAGGEAGGFFSTVKPLLTEFREMLASVEEKAADWGKRFGEIFNNFIDRLRELKAWFDNLSPSMQSAILQTLGIGSAVLVGIGPALKIVGSLITSFGTLAKSVGLLFGPVGIAVAAVAALIAIGVALWQNWDTVKEKMAVIFEAFSPMVETLKGAFQDLMDSLGPIWESLKQLFESLKPILMAVGAVIGGVLAVQIGLLISIFAAVVSAIGPFVNAFINLLDVVVNVFKSIFALMTGDFDAALEYWLQAGESSIEFFKNLWDGVVNFFETFVQTIIDFFMGLYNTLVGNSIVPDMVNAIIKWLTNLGTWAKDIVLSMINAVVQFFVSMKDRAVQRVQDMANGARQKFEDMRRVAREKVQAMFTAVRDKFNDMRNSVQERMQKIRDKVEELWNKAQDFLSNIDLRQIGRDIIQGLINGIGSMASAVWTKAKEIAGGIKDSIMKTLRIASPSKLMIQYGKWVGEGLAIGMENMIRLISRQATLMANAAIPNMGDMGAMQFAMPNFGDRGIGISASNPGSSPEFQLPLPPIIVNNTIEMDGREVGKSVVKIVTEEQDREKKRRDAFRGN